MGDLYMSGCSNHASPEAAREHAKALTGPHWHAHVVHTNQDGTATLYHVQPRPLYAGQVACEISDRDEVLTVR